MSITSSRFTITNPVRVLDDYDDEDNEDNEDDDDDEPTNELRPGTSALREHSHAFIDVKRLCTVEAPGLPSNATYDWPNGARMQRLIQSASLIRRYRASRHQHRWCHVNLMPENKTNSWPCPSPRSVARYRACVFRCTTTIPFEVWPSSSSSSFLLPPLPPPSYSYSFLFARSLFFPAKILRTIFFFNRATFVSQLLRDTSSLTRL